MCLVNGRKRTFETVQLSANADKLRDLSAGVEGQSMSRLKSSFAFSLSLDESTDMSGLASTADPGSVIGEGKCKVRPGRGRKCPEGE